MVLSKHLHRLRKDQRGTVSVIMGLLIVPLVGALGIGFEVSNWYMTGRGMQNAADAAALAAATNGILALCVGLFLIGSLHYGRKVRAALPSKRTYARIRRQPLPMRRAIISARTCHPPSHTPPPPAAVP
jgi:hypothetical protein